MKHTKKSFHKKKNKHRPSWLFLMGQQIQNYERKKKLLQSNQGQYQINLRIIMLMNEIVYEAENPICFDHDECHCKSPLAFMMNIA